MRKTKLRSRLSLALLAPVLLLGGGLLGCNQERNQSIRHMNEGIALHQRGRLAEAVGELRKATEVDPTNDRAFFYQGLILYSKLAKLDEGQKAFRRAIELNGNDFEYHYHLGTLLSQREDWRASIDALEKAIKLRPDHGESLLRHGVALERLEKYDLAQEQYIAAIRANPRLPEAYHALGLLYLRFEQYPYAAQVLKNAVENNPDSAENQQALGMVYQAQKRFDDAIRQFERSLALDPSNASTLFNLGMTHYANNNPRRALEQLKLYLARKSAGEDSLRSEIARDTITRIELGDLATP